MPGVERVLNALESGGYKPRRVGKGWKALCPGHDDHNPSLDVSQGRKGALLKCRSVDCALPAILGPLGLQLKDLFDAPSTSNGRGPSHAKPEIIATYDYVDESGKLLYQACRYTPKGFKQRRPDGFGSWYWKLDGVRRVLFRLPELLASKPNEPIYIVEGEKDVLALVALGCVATTNSGGAGKWRAEYNAALATRDVVVLPDNDPPGREHAERVAASLAAVARSVRILALPNLPSKGDASDWIAQGGTAEALLALALNAPAWAPSTNAAPSSDAGSQGGSANAAKRVPGPAAGGVARGDFHAYMPMHSYIFVPSRELWPASSVNARLAPIPTGRTKTNGDKEYESASAWLDQHQAVEQMTWCPGEPELIEGRLISHGGWIERPGCRSFNLYRPPTIQPGDAGQAGPWLEHIRRIYPLDADHIVLWLAHRVQRPQEKINHTLVLGGGQGIGKDTLLEPVKSAVGPWNFDEVGPAEIMGRFNGFVKTVILRVNEAHDLGDMNRHAFYDRMKRLTAAPPDVLRVDEKNIREYAVFNVTGVIITTNHQSDGIYLPADDRRHYVAWSELTKESFPADYWTNLYRWFASGGLGHVAAYLAQMDLTEFKPKAPPPKTAAFWHIVQSNQRPEDAELADALDRLGNPDATTVSQVVEKAATEDFANWLRDRRNSRAIPHRFEQLGYTAVRNEDVQDGLWVVNSKRQQVYAKKSLTPRDRIVAARKIMR